MRLAPQLLDGPEPAVVVADRAYDGNPTRERIAATGAAACIPPTKTRNESNPYDGGIDKNRNRGERLFGRLKQFAASPPATRSGPTPSSARAGWRRPSVTYDDFVHTT